MWVLIDGIIQKVLNAAELDLRTVIRPGDTVRYINKIAGDPVVMDGENCFIGEGIVMAVYKKLCLVRTAKRSESVSWWDFVDINNTGYSPMKAYTEMLRRVDQGDCYAS